jgi:Flp pilus assembly protein TadG
MVTPVLLAMLLLLVYAARVNRAQAEVDGAARDAARAASIERDAGAAGGAAQDAAGATLAGAGITCQSFNVVTDTGAFGPDGAVRVEVSCTVGLSDLGFLPLPTSRTMTASFTAPIDRLRGTVS